MMSNLFLILMCYGFVLLFRGFYWRCFGEKHIATVVDLHAISIPKLPSPFDYRIDNDPDGRGGYGFGKGPQRNSIQVERRERHSAPDREYFHFYYPIVQYEVEGIMYTKRMSNRVTAKEANYITDINKSVEVYHIPTWRSRTFMANYNLDMIYGSVYAVGGFLLRLFFG